MYVLNETLICEQAKNEPELGFLLTVVFLIIIAFMSLIGNMMTLYALSTEIGLNYKGNILILGLSVTDLLAGFFGSVLMLINMLSKYESYEKYPVLGIIQYGNVTGGFCASIITIMFIGKILSNFLY